MNEQNTYVQPASPAASEGDASSSSPGDSKQLFTALVESCGWNPSEITRSGRGAANRAVRELREVGATAAEVARRAAHYRKRWPAVSITPSAIARHWAELAQEPRETFAGRAGGEWSGREALLAKEDAAIERAEVDIPRRDLIVRLVEASNAGTLSPERYRELDALVEGVTTYTALAEARSAVDGALAEDFS